MKTLIRAMAAYAFLVTLPMFGQYQTPTVDGVIESGEYAHHSGNWYLTWDATWLYIGVTGNAAGSAESVYLDIDPLSTPAGGSDTNGSLTGRADSADGPVTALTATLPFRADARMVFSQAGGEYRLRDGAGGWGSDDNNPGNFVPIRDETTGDFEAKIRWGVLPGLSGVPSSFAWLAYKNIDTGGGTTALTDPMPAANATGVTAVDERYFFYVTSTADGAATDPFFVQQVTWSVTSIANSGANTLRDRITLANADTVSARRYIVFDMSGGDSIDITAALPNVTKTTTIDGFTQTGGTTPAVTLLGPGTGSGVTGIILSGTTGSVVRGLVAVNFAAGISISGGSSNTVAGNYSGTTGSSASPNGGGISILNSTGNTIGGTAATDRNVISGNNTGVYLENATDTVITNNYIGTNAAGSAAIANSDGIITFLSTNVTIGAAGAGNVISGNSAGVLLGTTSGVSIQANMIGVGADGTTAIPNTSVGVSTNDSTSELVIGSEATPNIIANNATAVSVENGGGLLVRGNSFFGNTQALNVTGVEQPAPVISAAQVGQSKTYVTFSAASAGGGTQSLRIDLYLADSSSATPQGKTFKTSVCYAGNSLSNQLWAADATFTAGDKVVLMATAYSDIACTTAGAGSSEFSALFTTTALPAAVFTGPGNFSDTAKWSGGAIPLNGQDFVIVGSCTFDSGVTEERAYGSMTLGSGATSGALSWGSGTTVALDVYNVSSAVAGGTITATDSGAKLRIRGTITTTDLAITATAGLIEFAGTAQTIPVSSSYSQLGVTGSATFSGTLTVTNKLDVSGTLSGNSGSILSIEGTIAATGTLSLYALQVATGKTLSAQNSFTLSNTLTVNGTLTPLASAVITGSSLTGTGTVRVTGTAASNSFGTQYLFTSKSLTNLIVEFAGTSLQSIDSAIYGYLTIDNAAGANIKSSITIATNLTLTNGLVGHDVGTIIISSTGTIVATSGRISTGVPVRRSYATGTQSVFFPFGNSTSPTPVTLDVNATGSGTVTITAHGGEHASVAGSGIDSGRNVNQYWSVQFNSGSRSSHSLTSSFGTAINAGTTPTAFVMRVYNNNTLAWFTTTNVATATTISSSGWSATNSTTYDYAAGNQAIDHFVVTASSPQSSGTPFTTTVTAQDVLNTTVGDGSSAVTMTSSTGNVQYDSDGNGTFGDNVKSLTDGTFTISTKDVVAESVTLTAAASSKTGSSSSITILAVPTNVVAVATSTSAVSVSWTAASGATSYEIWRSSLNSAYALIDTTTGTTYPNTGLTPDTTYLYRVKAVHAAGTTDFSSFDAATTTIFTDTSLSGVKVKAVHLTELRTAVNAFRAAAGLGAATFTDAALTGVKIKAAQLSELRTALDAARIALLLPALSYTDSTITALTTKVKGAHVTELRGGVM